MTDTLYGYYERELLFIREEAQQFAQQYPSAAGRLLLDPNGSVDPHVERLIEAFALLTGRVQKKLDDDFSQLTDGLFHVLYPHYLAPIPSFAVVQFEGEPGNAKPEGVLIQRGTGLHTQPVDDCECRFRTCYNTTLWPVEVEHAQLQTLPLSDGLHSPEGTVAALRLQLRCLGQFRFADLQLDALRVHLSGADEVVALLHGLIFHSTIGMQLRSTDKNVTATSIHIPPDRGLHAVGFDHDEGLLPYPPQSFLGYRLLTELFAFPQKFHFVDVSGWREAARQGFGQRAEVILYLNRVVEGLEQEIDKDNFRLGCCPVANLFAKTAEPIKLDHNNVSYCVRPDVHQPLATEVHSIESVMSVNPRSSTQYQPFYGLRHDTPWTEHRDEGAYWYAQRRRSMQDGDDGTDVFLHLVDRHFDPTQPADSVIVVKATCTNRDLPLKLQQAGSAIHFQLETSAPVRDIHCVRAPTAPRRPPLGRQVYWQLMSHLTLNYLSLEDDEQGCEALRDILRLYQFSHHGDPSSDAAVNQRLIDGILSVKSRRIVGRVDRSVPVGFCRGVEVTVELNPRNFVGTGVYLFASVLERFLSMFTSINSFSQLVLRVKGNDLVVKKWPRRGGEARLL